MSSIQVQLPDGSVREVPSGTTPFAVAESISPRLAQAAVVARIRPLKAAEGAPFKPSSGLSGEQNANSVSPPHSSDRT